MYRVYYISSMYFVPHFGHAKVYETSIWTPCFQISAKTLRACTYHKAVEAVNCSMHHPPANFKQFHQVFLRAGCRKVANMYARCFHFVGNRMTGMKMKIFSKDRFIKFPSSLQIYKLEFWKFCTPLKLQKFK